MFATRIRTAFQKLAKRLHATPSWDDIEDVLEAYADALEETAEQWACFFECVEHLGMSDHVEAPYDVIFLSQDASLGTGVPFDSWAVIEGVDTAEFPPEAAALFEDGVAIGADDAYDPSDPKSFSSLVIRTEGSQGEVSIHIVTREKVWSFGSPLNLTKAMLAV